MILSIFSIPLLADNLILPISMLVIAILFTKVGTRFGVPVMLIFLLLGMLAGPDGIGLSVKNLHLAEFLGHLAMTIILLTGGLETSLEETRPVQKPAIVLSSLGVLITIVALGFFSFYVLGPKIGGVGATLIGCILLGAVLSSTDSASIFSILRSRRLQLRENLGPMLEFESGSNDPMAYVVTLMLVKTIADSASLGLGLLYLLLQVALGAFIGYGVGKISVKLLEKVKLTNSSLYAILILSLAFLSDGLASAFNGNGLLALYLTAIIIGNSSMPAKRDVLKFFDSITWLCQLLMFLMLGLLARPSEIDFCRPSVGCLPEPPPVQGIFYSCQAVYFLGGPERSRSHPLRPGPRTGRPGRIQHDFQHRVPGNDSIPCHTGKFPVLGCQEAEPQHR